jgi:hypothetical protein
VGFAGEESGLGCHQILRAAALGMTALRMTTVMDATMRAPQPFEAIGT